MFLYFPIGLYIAKEQVQIMNTSEVLQALLPLIIANSSFILLCIIYAFIYPRKERDKLVQERMHPSFIGVYLREFWYWLINPLIKFFIMCKITPNMVTGSSLIFAAASGYFYYKGDVALAGWILVVGSTMDMVDGKLARETGQVSRAGAFFDSNVDRYSEGFIFLGISLYYRSDLFMLIICFLAIIGSMMVSYARARGEAVGAKWHGGLMQRVERIVLLGLCSTFYPFLGLIWKSYGFHPDMTMKICLIVLTVLSNYTAILRIVTIFREIKQQEVNDE